MSNIGPRTYPKEVSHHNELISLCWNRALDLPPNRNEVIDQQLGLFQSGPKKVLVQEILAALKRAKSVVCVSTFVLQQSEITDELLALSKKGVRVYLLTASDNQLEKEDFEMTDFDRKVIPQHKMLLESFAGSILVRTANHFHAKFILIDPNAMDSQGFLLTANLTRGALFEDVAFQGHQFQCNFELAVRLSRQQIRGVFQQFLYGFWHEAKHELFEKEKLSGVGNAPHSIELTDQAVQRTVGDERSLKNSILNIIDEATSYIILSAWSFDLDHEVAEKLLKKAQEGVKITIMTRNRNIPALAELVKHDAKIYGHERLHGKFIISDGNQGLLLTANFTHLGLDEGFEAGIKLSQPQINLLLDLHQQWAKSCRWTLEYNIAKKDINGEILIWGKDELDSLKVEKENINQIEMNAKSMTDYLNPTLTLPDPITNKLALISRYDFIVHPPHRPPQAKLIDMKSLSENNEKDKIIATALKQYALYRHKGKIYIDVTNDKQLSDVVELEGTHGWIGTVSD